jgi:hypothetical protein
MSLTRPWNTDWHNKSKNEAGNLNYLLKGQTEFRAQGPSVDFPHKSPNSRGFNAKLHPLRVQQRTSLVALQSHLRWGGRGGWGGSWVKKWWSKDGLRNDGFSKMLIPFSTKRWRIPVGFGPIFGEVGLVGWSFWCELTLQFLGSSPPDEVAIFHAEPIGGVLEHPGHRHS